jgi:hypothetical protein
MSLSQSAIVVIENEIEISKRAIEKQDALIADAQEVVKALSKERSKIQAHVDDLQKTLEDHRTPEPKKRKMEIR